MTRQMVMGVETEFSVAALSRDGGRVEPGKVAVRLLDSVGRSMRHIRDGTTAGVFLENGGRLYVDTGSHPEFATPEASNPWEVLRYVRAGERIMKRAAARLDASSPLLREVLVLRSNVDYSNTTTWGCHSSYMHRTNPAILPAHLVPHFATRLVYSGAGGFDPLSPGLEFRLSPRVSFLKEIVSSSSTGQRGIFHTKNESLTEDRYHRMHVLCGETLCSDIATVLKIGATALILACIGKGERFGADLALSDPLWAMRVIASDPTCRTKVRLDNGQMYTAVEIQRCYLDRVERLAGSGVLPDWATPLCNMWRQALGLLEEGAPESVQTTLDWAIKWGLYRDRIRDKSQSRRNELMAADVRFGQLGGGLFEDLERSGALTHRLLDDDEVERAMTEPPSAGRARPRSELVGRHGGTGLLGPHGRYRCDWATVWSEEGGRYVDLSDPFEEAVAWRVRRVG